MQQDSIYYYKPSGFREYIRTIADKSITISHALSTFRELKCLPERYKQMTVHELLLSTISPQLIQELYNALRAGMQPESKFKLPYKKADREKELLDSIAENYDIDTNKAQAKVVTGHYDDGTQVFNYALEVVIAPRKDIGVNHAGKVEFIGNINSTPSIDGGAGYFSNGNYQWFDRKGNLMSASSIISILHECGFNTSSYYTSKKIMPCVVYVNLKTPCPDWLSSAGKTHINLNPYADDIAKTVSSLAYKMPSYHGKGFAIKYESYSSIQDPDQVAKNYLIIFLKERREAVEAEDPSLKTRDRITQSGVWYRIRPRMIKAGYEPRKDWGTTRRSLTGSISKVIKELWPYENITREDLGIIASSRATMLYKGQAYPVTIDNVKELAKKGVAIIIIEKEGIADILAPHAEKYGIALVHTQGRLTEYGKDLIEEVKETGGSIWILVDYDAYGDQIAKSTRTKTPRIGITRQTVKWLQQNGYPELEEVDVEEEYAPEISTDDEYLKHHRIELDSITAQVGAEGLWEYILHQAELPEFSPEGFDLNRVIDVEKISESKELYPKIVKDFLSYLDENIENLLEDEKIKIKDELENTKELTEIEKKEEEIEDRFSDIVADDKSEVMQTIITKFTELMQPGVLPEPKAKESSNQASERAS